MRPHLRTPTCFHRSALYLTLSSICEAPGLQLSYTIVIPDVCPRRFWWSLLTSRCSARHLLAVGTVGALLTPSRIGFSNHRPIPWNLCVFRIEEGVAGALGGQRTFYSSWICLFRPIHNFLLCKLLKRILWIDHSWLECRLTVILFIYIFCFLSALLIKYYCCLDLISRSFTSWKLCKEKPLTPLLWFVRRRLQ